MSDDGRKTRGGKSLTAHYKRTVDVIQRINVHPVNRNYGRGHQGGTVQLADLHPENQSGHRASQANAKSSVANSNKNPAVNGDFESAHPRDDKGKFEPK